MQCFLTRVMLLTALLLGSVVAVGQWAEGPAAEAAPGGFVALPAPARLLDTRTGASTIDGVSVGSGAVGSGSTTELTVAGRAGLAEGVDTVALNVAMVAPSDPGYATVWPCDAPRPNASNVNFTAGQTIANVVLSRVSAAGTVCIFVETFTGVGTVELIADVTGSFDGGFVALSAPARLLDTRAGAATIDGVSVGSGAVGSGSTTELTVAGRAGLAEGVDTVALNVAMVAPSDPGYATVWPCDETRPNASNVNFTAGQTIANVVLSRVSAAGTVCIFVETFTGVGTVELIADVTGSFDGGFVALPAPARLLDTRTGASTIDGVSVGSGAVGSGSTTELTVAGRAGVAEGVDTVALNVAMVAPSDPGYATVWPCDETRPNASNVNFAAGQTIANVVLSRVSAAGTVCIFVETFTGVGTVELIADVTGSLTSPPTTPPTTPPTSPPTTTPPTTTPPSTTPPTTPGPTTTTPPTTTPPTTSPPPPMGGAWADAERRFRLPITITVGVNERAATAIDVEVDLAAALVAAGGAGTVDARSLRLVEVDAAGTVVDATVSSQFDQRSGSPAGVGTLVVGVEGVTTAGSTRRYHVYFDTTGSGFTPVTTAAQIGVTTGDSSAGESSFIVSTPSGEWTYHRRGGGFSSLVDPAGNDWLNYSTTLGSAGSFRGIPNAVPPPQGHFHPSSTTSVTTLVASGPLKVTIESVVDGGAWAARWEIYPDRAHMSVLAAAGPYWFLYEGTPGGQIDAGDLVVRPTGAPTPLSEAWDDNVQYAGFVDPARGRSLVALHHQVNNVIDSHRVMEGNMTVFGFGRVLGQLNPGLTGTSNTFTVALLATSDTAAVRRIARGLLTAPAVGVGTPVAQPPR